MHTSSTIPNHDQLYAVAEGQAGYFTSAQARAAGFSTALLSYHARTGQFQRVAPRVYRLTQFPASSHEDLFVAWLRAGPKSVLSHDSALAVYELSDHLPSEVHVTIPATSSRRRAGLRLHTRRLDASEATRYMGLPVTTVARTLADVASDGLAEELVLQGLAEALGRGLTSIERLTSMAEKRGGRFSQLFERFRKRELLT